MKKFVESNIVIEASANIILDALLEPEPLKKWWGVSDAFIQKKDGGMYVLTWGKTAEGIKYISTGRIKLYDKRSYLHLEDLMYLNSNKGILGPFTLRYTISKQGKGNLLTIRQDGFEKSEEQDWYYEAVKNGWPQALILLKNFLEGQ